MVQCSEPLDTGALAQALTEIVRRHEAWRTVFFVSSGQVHQQILPPAPLPLKVVDLTHLPEVQREPDALRIAVAEARQPFDLERGPLVRAVLIRLHDHNQRLFITAHHLVVDGLSYFKVFLPELHALYNTFRKGLSAAESGLSALPIQYAEFSQWQRRWLTDELLAPQLEFWKQQLAEVHELNLATDFPRSAQPARDGARHPLLLSARLSEELWALSRRYGVSLFTVILSAWKTLLYRYTGQSDVVVGSAVAGRRTPETEPLIGFFANNLVLRTQLVGDMSFGQLLADVHKVLQSARRHQDVPFERLIAFLNMPRMLERNPLFNTTCIVMPKVTPPTSPPYWAASRFDIGVAKLDLYLELHQSPDGLSGHIEYRTDLFRKDTVARMAGHLTTLLADLVRHPDRSLEQLRLLTPEEEQQLKQFAGSPVLPVLDVGARVPLPQLFERQVERTPDALALLYEEQQITYQELNRRANQLAHFLRSRDIGPDVLVGLCLDRTPEMIIAILGVHKAGGAYVPIDPAYPAERVRFLLADTKPALLITSASLRATLPLAETPILCLDQERAEIARHSDQNTPPAALPNHLAYVIHTSGSTGKPKGVLIEHASLSNLAQVAEQQFALGPGDRVLQFFSFSFDGSVFDLLLALTSGAALVQAPRRELIPGAELARLLREQQITVLHVNPSALAALPEQDFPALRIIAVGGESCPAQLVARWAPGRRFYNGYGPTECTVMATLAACEPQTPPTIGRPIPDVQVYILDRALQPVPIGVPGEIYIGGAGVARGYLRRPELSAERFVPNPFADVGSPRLYRTGDRGRFLPDGNIEFLGRCDRQVKLRGFRIELGEIEDCLLRHPAISEAAVMLRAEGPGDRQLSAYVVPRGAATTELLAELKAWLKAELPDHMIPASFLILDRLPLSAAGKLERSALPAPAAQPAAVRPAYEAPAFEIERSIIAVWQQVLGCEGIGVRDNFFDLGGHSLRLAEVQSRLQAVLTLVVPMMDLFRYPTVRELALHLSSTTAPQPTRGPDPEGPLATPSRERAKRQRFALSRAGSGKLRPGPGPGPAQ